MKILLSLLFLSGILFADDYDFIVDNEIMVSAYFDIFNAMASIFTNNSYLNLLKVVFLIGGFFVFTIGLISQSSGSSSPNKNTITGYSSYLIYGTMILTIFLYPGSDNKLLIKTNNIKEFSCVSTSPTAVEVKLPGLLPEIFGGINSFSVYLTSLSAAAYTSISNDPDVVKSFASLSRSGFGLPLQTPIEVFGFKLGDFKIDPSLNNQLSSTFGSYYVTDILNSGVEDFYKECVFMIGSTDKADSSKIQDALKNSAEIEETLKGLFNGSNVLNVYLLIKNPIVNSVVTKTYILNSTPSNNLISYNNNVGTCKQFYDEIYAPSLQTIRNSPSFNCSSEKLKDVTVAGLYSLTGSPDMSTIGGLQNIIIQSGISSSLAEVSDSSVAHMFSAASGKSISEMAIVNSSQGQYMAQILPYLQMSIRAVIYAFFPFVFVVILLPGGYVVLKNYLVSLIWIELWSPVAAVMNLFLSYFSLDRLNTLYNNYDMYSPSLITNEALMLSGVAGYLYASIPALTWLILKGSGKMFEDFSHGLASYYAKHLTTEDVMKDRTLLAAKNKFNEINKLNSNITEFSNLEASQSGNKRGVGTWNDQSNYTNSLKFTKSQQEGKAIAGSELGFSNVEKTAKTDLELKIKTISKSVIEVSKQNKIDNLNEDEKNNSFINLNSTTKGFNDMLRITGTQDLMTKLSSDGIIDASKVENLVSGKNIDKIISSEVSIKTSELLGDGNIENGMQKLEDGNTQLNIANISETLESSSNTGDKLKAFKMLNNQIKLNPKGYSNDIKNIVNKALKENLNTESGIANFVKDSAILSGMIKNATEITSAISDIGLQTEKTNKNITFNKESNFTVKDLLKQMSVLAGQINGLNSGIDLLNKNGSLSKKQYKILKSGSGLSRFLKQTKFVSELSTESKPYIAQNSLDRVKENLSGQISTKELTIINTADLKEIQSSMNELSKDFSKDAEYKEWLRNNKLKESILSSQAYLGKINTNISVFDTEASVISNSKILNDGYKINDLSESQALSEMISAEETKLYMEAYGDDAAKLIAEYDAAKMITGILGTSGLSGVINHYASGIDNWINKHKEFYYKNRESISEKDKLSKELLNEGLSLKEKEVITEEIKRLDNVIIDSFLNERFNELKSTKKIDKKIKEHETINDVEKKENYNLEKNKKQLKRELNDYYLPKDIEKTSNSLTAELNNLENIKLEIAVNKVDISTYNELIDAESRYAKQVAKIDSLKLKLEGLVNRLDAFELKNNIKIDQLAKRNFEIETNKIRSKIDHVDDLINESSNRILSHQVKLDELYLKKDIEMSKLAGKYTNLTAEKVIAIPNLVKNLPVHTGTVVATVGVAAILTAAYEGIIEGKSVNTVGILKEISGYKDSDSFSSNIDHVSHAAADLIDWTGTASSGIDVIKDKYHDLENGEMTKFVSDTFTLAPRVIFKAIETVSSIEKFSDNVLSNFKEYNDLKSNVKNIEKEIKEY